MVENIILYHGSNVVVETPCLINQLRTLDFGSGFYTTTNQKQAVAFAGKVMTRTRTNTKFVSVYDFALGVALQELKVLQFVTANEEWLDFVCQNRQGKYVGVQHDVIAGPVANDDIFTTLQLYEAGAYTREQALVELKIKKLYDQYVFASDKAISMLRYMRSFDANEESANG
jgi:hypothetical protein